MDLFASIFDSKSKCHNCAHLFKLTSKRRKCVICSNFKVELIFCKRCSIKVSKHGFFSSKRYCHHCHNRETQKIPDLAVSQIPKVQSLEEAAENIGLTNEELQRHKEEVAEVVETINNGVRSMPRASSVKTI